MLPILSDSGLHEELRFEIGLILHDPLYLGLKMELVLMDFKNELVMDLENHLRLVSSIGQHVIDLKHRELDDVCGSPLDRHIDRFAFGLPTDDSIGIIEIFDVSPPSEECLHVSIYPRLLEERIIISPDPCVELVEFLDICIRLGDGDADLLGKPESRDPVDDSEIDCLRTSPLL